MKNPGTYEAFQSTIFLCIPLFRPFLHRTSWSWKVSMASSSTTDTQIAQKWSLDVTLKHLLVQNSSIKPVKLALEMTKCTRCTSLQPAVVELFIHLYIQCSLPNNSTPNYRSAKKIQIRYIRATKKIFFKMRLQLIQTTLPFCYYYYYYYCCCCYYQYYNNKIQFVNR